MFGEFTIHPAAQIIWLQHFEGHPDRLLGIINNSHQSPVWQCLLTKNMFLQFKRNLKSAEVATILILWCKMLVHWHLAGPDICGYSTKKVHVIFNYKGKNHLIKKDIKCKARLTETVLDPERKLLLLLPYCRNWYFGTSPFFSVTGWWADTLVHVDPQPRPDLRGEDWQWEGRVRISGGGLGFPAPQENQGPRGQETRGLGWSPQDRRCWRYQAWGILFGLCFYAQYFYMHSR